MTDNRADDLMAAVFGDAVRDIRFFRFGVFDFLGRDMVIARSGYSKQGGFEIYVEGGDIGMPLCVTARARPTDAGATGGVAATVSKDAAKAAFELFLPGATAITGLTEDIINKVKEGANC